MFEKIFSKKKAADMSLQGELNKFVPSSAIPGG